MFTPALSTASGSAAQALSMGTPWTKTSDQGPRGREGGPRSFGSVLSFAQDQEIYRAGDDARSFFKVVSGVVRSCKFLSDGRRQIGAFHVAGDVFGVEADGEYSLCAEAVCDCTVVSYHRRSIEGSLSHDLALSRELFSYAMRRLARAEEHALLLGRRSAAEKVAAFLVAWAAHSPGGGPDANVVSLAMTRQDIADYLGLTIETVSRTLSQFERGALIAFSSARQIRLEDPSALRNLYF